MPLKKLKRLKERLIDQGQLLNLFYEGSGCKQYRFRARRMQLGPVIRNSAPEASLGRLQLSFSTDLLTKRNSAT